MKYEEIVKFNKTIVNASKISIFELSHIIGIVFEKTEERVLNDFIEYNRNN